MLLISSNLYCVQYAGLVIYIMSRFIFTFRFCTYELYMLDYFQTCGPPNDINQWLVRKKYKKKKKKLFMKEVHKPKCHGCKSLYF